MAWSNVVPELTRLHRFIDLAVSGLKFGMEATRSVEQHRRVAQVLRRPDPYGTEDTYQTALAKATELEAFAKEQASSKFSYVHELGIVKLWSILENAIDELTFERLGDPQGRAYEALNSLEGPLLPFFNASPDEQSEFLLGKLKSSVKAPLQRGVGRFEAILNPIGLGGPVEPLVAKAFIDLSETRNVVVHRGGIADKQYLSRCPWNQTLLGDKLRVRKRHFDWHACAADWYVVEVDARLESLQAGVRPVNHDELQIELLVSLRQLNPVP
jgi:hypothetical protein